MGSGFSPVEFKTFGMTMEEAKERFWEATDVILKAWEQEEFSHKGKYYQYDNATLYVKPVQKPGPPIWLAASSDDTLVKAGELGWPMMGIPFARSNNLLDVKAKNDLYKDANYVRSGHKAEPSIMVALHVYLNENENDAVTLSRRLFRPCHFIHQDAPSSGIEDPQFRRAQEGRLSCLHYPIPSRRYLPGI